MSRRTPDDHFRPSRHVGPWPRERPYARRAIHEALENGLTAEELDGVLGRLDPTDLVPPHRDEDVPEYGRRAASEIMVRYLLS